MQIIILNQYFYPDHSATSQLMTDLAESLVARGISVTAIAGRGGYNGGVRLASREQVGGINIRRAWSTGFGKENIIGRLADYLTFYIGAFWELLRVPRHDIVLALTTPPLIGVIAVIVGWLRGMHTIALMQDIYPDVAIALGTINARNPLTRLLDFMTRKMLCASDRIIVLGDCMRERVQAKMGDHDTGDRIDVIHNWADGDIINNQPENGKNFRREHNIADKFVVLFSGNFGRVNDFVTVLDAAARLRDQQDIVFLFIGGGAQAGMIEQFAVEHSLTNLRMLPYQPRESLVESIAAGDALLVTLAEGLAGLSVPSKTYPILAAGRPVLYVGDRRSAIARLIADYGFGEVIAAGNGEALSHVIIEWSKNKEVVGELGRTARRVFEARFDRQIAVDAYLNSFETCLKDSRTSKPIRPSEARAVVTRRPKL